MITSLVFVLFFVFLCTERFPATCPEERKEGKRGRLGFLTEHILSVVVSD